MAELADALVSRTSELIPREGSTPSSPTTEKETCPTCIVLLATNRFESSTAFWSQERTPRFKNRSAPMPPIVRARSPLRSPGSSNPIAIRMGGLLHLGPRAPALSAETGPETICITNMTVTSRKGENVDLIQAFLMGCFIIFVVVTLPFTLLFRAFSWLRKRFKVKPSGCH